MNARAMMLLAAVAGAAGCAAARRPAYVVTASVADLRAQPGSAAASTAHDPLEESQLLYGEQVRVLETRDGWVRVEALEQPEYSHQRRWQGYPGWIALEQLAPIQRRAAPNAVVTAKSAAVWRDPDGASEIMRLPIGTRIAVTNTEGRRWPVVMLDGAIGWIAAADAEPLAALAARSPAQRRAAVIAAAGTFIGDGYYWGGRSPDGLPGARVTGVDCSGLVNLAYRAAGVAIPRDAHEQFLRARRIDTPQPADLVFLSADDNPAKIVHVMLYAGDGWLIEAPGTGALVRRIDASQRLGRPIEQVHPRDVIGHQSVFFGAYVP